MSRRVYINIFDDSIGSEGCLIGTRFPARNSVPHPDRVWRQIDPCYLMSLLIMRGALPALHHRTFKRKVNMPFASFVLG